MCPNLCCNYGKIQTYYTNLNDHSTRDYISRTVGHRLLDHSKCVGWPDYGGERGSVIYFYIQKSMVFKIIAKNRFQHVMHHNYTIPPRPQYMYDTLSYCPCCTFCILFLFCSWSCGTAPIDIHRKCNIGLLSSRHKELLVICGYNYSTPNPSSRERSMDVFRPDTFGSTLLVLSQPLRA